MLLSATDSHVSRDIVQAFSYCWWKDFSFFGFGFPALRMLNSNKQGLFMTLTEQTSITPSSYLHEYKSIRFWVKTYWTFACRFLSWHIRSQCKLIHIRKTGHAWVNEYEYKYNPVMGVTVPVQSSKCYVKTYRSSKYQITTST